MSIAQFTQLENAMRQNGVDGVLTELIKQLEADKKYHELFEALKMQLRHRLNLPVTYDDSGDELNAQQRQLLEDGLIEACRRVGTLLIRDGRVREGWVYLRPVGESDLVAAELVELQATDDNMDELIEVLLYEGVDPQRGFSLVLDHYGTCNAITTYESQMHGMPTAAQRAAGAMLVRHVHAELLENVKAHVAQQQEQTKATEQKTSAREANRLSVLLEGRSWLTEGGNYHIDTSHLSSTVRIGRVLDDRETLELALDLTRYGKQLEATLQYPGEPPFTDLYGSHEHFYNALLGYDVEAALDFFRQRADESNIDEDGSAAVETYIQLLSLVGRLEAAIEATIRMIPPGSRTIGIAPSLLQLSREAGSYGRLIDCCRQRGDLLGFATGLVHQG